MRGEGSCGTRVGASHTSRPPAFPSRADGQYDYTFGIPVRAVSPASQDPESSPPISLWLLSVQHGNEPSFGYPNNHISLLLLLRYILHNGTGLGNEIKDAYGGHRGHMRVCKCSVGEVRSVVSTLPRIYLQRPDCPPLMLPELSHNLHVCTFFHRESMDTVRAPMASRHFGEECDAQRPAA